jgi:cell division septal protein FtsQ
MEVEAGREEVWGNCFLADEQGFLFDRAPVYTGNVYPRYYGSLVHAEPVGQGLAEPTEFARWQELFSTLHEQERELKALLFVDERDVELYVSGGLRVLTLRQEDTNTVAKRLITTLNALSDEKLGRVEYIDMRFGNKVYVKYVDTSAPTTAIEPTEPIETIPPSPPSESSQPGVASSTDERDE